MENKGNIWSAVVTVLVGVVMVCLHGVTTRILVMVMGAILIATGIINFLVASTNGNKPGPMAFITSIACAVLGLWWVLDPDTNVMIIVRLIGALAILSGIYRMYNMKVTFSQVKFPALFYVLPVLVLLCGVVMEIWPNFFANALIMVVGIVLIVYGIAMLCQNIKIKSYSEPPVEDVKAKEITSSDN